ncbi:MAG: hypothetical protein CVV02_00970 [Firmicutes bacterium HGW-Firmicutes-7]|nr:MAG: hypothetical protein CVV02_00970 [Firmicutes bacterium HGW-Firmicutes-7]
MNERWIIAIILVILFVLGFIKIAKYKFDLDSKQKFVIEYAEKLNTLFNGNYDSAIYSWLIQNLNRIQGELYHNGLIDFKPSYVKQYISNYPILLNTVPKIRTNDLECEEICLAQDSILKQIGDNGRLIDFTIKELKNPFIWLREGIRSVVTFPIYLLFWSGLINNRSYTKIRHSWFFKLFTFIIALAGIMSSIITIIIGWDQFLATLHQVFNIYRTI